MEKLRLGNNLSGYTERYDGSAISENAHYAESCGKFSESTISHIDDVEDKRRELEKEMGLEGTETSWEKGDWFVKNTLFYRITHILKDGFLVDVYGKSLKYELIHSAYMLESIPKSAQKIEEPEWYKNANKTADDSIFLAKKIRGFYKDNYKMDLPKAKAIAHNLKLKLSENELMQACEVAVVMAAREIAQSSESLRVRYEKIRDLYEHQITIKPKDGQARFLQQFSTPAPLSFLAGEFVNGVKQPEGTFGRYFLEPSAGNGMLTIALNNYALYVNELDEVRYNNLKNQGFNVVTNEDATKMQVRPHYFSGVITNPPFAELKKEDYFRRKGKKGGKDIEYVFTKLDFKLSILALENMADFGRAAIIVGGKLASKVYNHKEAYWNKYGLLFGEFGSFVNYLNRQYNLVDVLYISGDLYQKQGTTFPIVMLLIDGRKQWDDRLEYSWHKFDSEKDSEIKSFTEYFNRMSQWIEQGEEKPVDKSRQLAKAKAKAKALELYAYSQSKILELKAKNN